MGQQQLLLTILVTVIVGVATVVAINTMTESRKQQNIDAVQQEIMMGVNDAQTYYYRSSSLGGGGRNFDNIKMSDLALSDTTQNGTYQITGTSNSITITGKGSHEGVDIQATATINSDGEVSVSWTKNIQ